MTTGASPQNWFDVGGEAYARYRPDYPHVVASFLADISPARRLAVDVGCGNGQLTLLLADVFDAVIGLDPSADQIAHATPHPKITYGVAAAEALTSPDGAADLICAAQAAHWFDLPRFYTEARRVAAPGAALALVGYGLAKLEGDIGARFDRFYAEIQGYWPPERRMVDTAYADIPFPFSPIPVPKMQIDREWDLDGLLGYVSTWSATRRARDAGKSPMLLELSRDLHALWGDPAQKRHVAWPIHARVGRL